MRMCVQSIILVGCLVIYSKSFCQFYPLSRYKDYRETPWSNTPYDLSKEFWAILACRLAFVIVFQVRCLHKNKPMSLWGFNLFMLKAFYHILLNDCFWSCIEGIVKEMSRSLPSVFPSRMWWCWWVTLLTGWSQTSPRTSVCRSTRRRSSWWSSSWRRKRAKSSSETATPTKVLFSPDLALPHIHLLTASALVGGSICPFIWSVQKPSAPLSGLGHSTYIHSGLLKKRGRQLLAGFCTCTPSEL